MLRAPNIASRRSEGPPTSHRKTRRSLPRSIPSAWARSNAAKKRPPFDPIVALAGALGTSAAAFFQFENNPLPVGAPAGAFLALGAKTVVVAEGRGARISFWLSAAQSQLRDRKLSFVGLNRDDVQQVKVTTPFTGLDSLWIPQRILAADFVVSMPKV